MRLLFLIFIIYIIIIIYFKLTNPDMTFVKSDIDNRYYMVRNLSNKQNAANILAYNRKKILYLIKHLYDNKNKYKDYEIYIDRLVDRFIDTNLSETSVTVKPNEYTSTTINKGDSIILCLRHKNDPLNFYDENFLYFIVLHEVSHIASPSYEYKDEGHGPKFDKIFTLLKTVAEELNQYTQIEPGPHEYCGIYIEDKN